MPDNQKNPVIMGNQMLSKAKSCQAHLHRLRIGKYYKFKFLIIDFI